MGMGYSDVFFVINDVDDSAKGWDDVNIDASEINDEVTRLGRLCFGMT
jgi:hypothetical protein